MAEFGQIAFHGILPGRLLEPPKSVLPQRVVKQNRLPEFCPAPLGERIKQSSTFRKFKAYALAPSVCPEPIEFSCLVALFPMEFWRDGTCSINCAVRYNFAHFLS